MPVPVRLVLLLLAVAAGAVAGVLGSFVHPVEAAGLPVGLLLAAATSVGAWVTCGLLLGRPGSAAAVLGWLVVVLLLSSRRPEGDLVVPGTAAGYAWLLGGLLLGAGCVALPYRRPGRAPAAPSEPAAAGR